MLINNKIMTDKKDGTKKQPISKTRLKTVSLLDITPGERVIHFASPTETMSQQAEITLKNKMDVPVMYKFRTNHVEAYRIRPPVGVIKPKAQWKVIVNLIAGSHVTPKDKLLVLSIKMDKNAAAKLSAAEMNDLWKRTDVDKQHEQTIRITQDPSTPGKTTPAKSTPLPHSAHVKSAPAKSKPFAPSFSRKPATPKAPSSVKKLPQDTTVKHMLVDLRRRNNILRLTIFVLLVILIALLVITVPMFISLKNMSKNCHPVDCRSRHPLAHHPFVKALNVDQFHFWTKKK